MICINKNKISKNIEILAPAKNLQYGIEAIKCGADSVYIGSKNFCVRHTASNTIRDIKKLVEFAHRYWVRVYVTINSLIYKEKYFKEIKEIIKKLYNIGVDAIIISDMGILTMDLPPIPIFASVNTRCLYVDKINFLHKIGINRVILPRELSFKEIENITHRTKCQLEVFIHGTMCMANGNCHLKYAQMIKNTKGKRKLLTYQRLSANNCGRCVVNCVKNYSLIDADNNYIVKGETLLNTHYYDLIDKLKNFIEIGIKSFKIEGRQRELSYVKNIVSLTNNKLEKILKNQQYK